MFRPGTYVERREALKNNLRSGIVLLPGNAESPMNYGANTYQFRQDSTFLYYFGIDLPGVAGIIDIEKEEETLFGDELQIEGSALDLLSFFRLFDKPEGTFNVVTP